MCHDTNNLFSVLTLCNAFGEILSNKYMSNIHPLCVSETKQSSLVNSCLKVWTCSVIHYYCLTESECKLCYNIDLPYKIHRPSSAICALL